MAARRLRTGPMPRTPRATAATSSANLRVSRAARAALVADARVTNLLDDAYADRADFAFGDHRYFPGRGRAYFVELGWRKD